jgi:hypothetical protein
MSRLHEITTWQQRLGYLPIPLFGLEAEQRFVLLNGNKGNFCLDITEDLNDPIDRWNSIAWSSDVDHYVRVKGDDVFVSRWDILKPEQYSVRALEDNLPSFQRYLEKDRAPRERSVVAHAIGVYRRLRSSFAGSGDEALMAFLGLLSQAWYDKSGKNLTDYWADKREASAALEQINGDQQGALLRDLEMGSAYDNNDPDFDLILRHAAGRIFQEAHYLVEISPQQDLDGFSSVSTVGPMTRSSGAYFTPTPLVRTVVEQTLKRLDLQKPLIRILDPACGSGEFLREFLRQLRQHNYQGEVAAFGFDISVAACHMARFALSMEKMVWNDSLEFHIDNRDSMDGQGWPSNIDCCLMNPPYGSWGNIDDARKQQLSNVLGPLYSRRPDISSAFAVLASRNLVPGGVLGAVLPASILDGKSASPVRSAMAEQVQICMLARLGNQSVFSDATVDPALVIAQKPSGDIQPSAFSTTMLWADHRAESSERALRSLRRIGAYDNQQFIPIDEDGFSIYPVASESLSPNDWAPRAYESYMLIKQLSKLKLVKDYFDVQQGVITGLNTAFILTNKEYRSLPAKERTYFRPAIVNDSISNGRISSDVWVFYPYNGEADGLAIRTEMELTSIMPMYYEQWLVPQKEALLKRSRIKPDLWWRLSEHRAWQIEKKQRMFSTYFGAHGSFSFDESGQHVVVQGYAWLPKTADALDDVYGLALTALLAAPAIDKLFAAVSNNLAGGQWNFSARFVGNMPFPNLWGRDRRSVAEMLARTGAMLLAGEAVEDAELSDLCARAYGYDFTSFADS